MQRLAAQGVVKEVHEGRFVRYYSLQPFPMELFHDTVASAGNRSVNPDYPDIFRHE
jgi:hypothetical protein